MLRSILAGLARAVQMVFDIVMLPLRGLLHALFPALSEPVGILDDEYESGHDVGADNPFANSHDAFHARDVEANLAMAWAADAAIANIQPPLPNIRPIVSDWLVSLSHNELDKLVTSGFDGIYGHLHLAIPVAGVPVLESRAEPHVPGSDRNLTSGGPAAAFSRA
ncbi:hypothetical protein CT676_26485 [Bradyrhizobium sp. MOS001]|uniref:hypothetical protein n=1 Tax=unclassified Bradyrhizobium TaxID=2631580 RepID=UPI001074C526|nr:hypothetical protein [Bradyrhizobium sp. MOS001]TFW58159.1 hypothetical protein CT676_26485 [Bradyrhizobium sp. MOS001]